MSKKKTDKFVVIDGEVRSTLHPDQPLRSRRDFLSAGLITSAATVTLPSLLTGIFAARIARGDGTSSCGSGGAGNPNLPAFFTIDCAGGMAMHSCFPALTADGNMPSDLDLLGLGADPNDYQLVSEFGVPYAVSKEVIDPMGLLKSNGTNNLGNELYKLPKVIKDRLAVVKQVCQSSSDSAINKWVSNSLVSAAGRKGTLVDSWFGSTNDASSGGNSTAALGYTGEVRSLHISDLAQLTKALGFGKSLTEMKTSALDRAVRSYIKMSEAQQSLLQRLGLGDQIAALFGCAATKNLQFINPAGGGSPDPRADANVQAIYGINAGSSTSDPNVVEATLVYNTLLGHCPSATITLGGADYHDMTRTSHDGFQARLATVLTRIFKLADALGQAAFAHVVTDGGISMGTVGNACVGKGDNNLTSGSQIYYLSKPGKPRVAINHLQAGVATDQAVADSRHYFGDVATAAQHVAFATYLGVAGINSHDQYKSYFKIGSDITIAQASKFPEAQLLGSDAA